MFVCCPEREAKKRLQKLGDLKQLVETIEEKMMVPCAMACPICGPPCILPPPPCPIVVPPPCPVEEVREPPCPPSPPDVMVCYKFETQEKRKNGRPSKKSNAPRRTKRAKSRELRASILYLGCDCEKRNGLQDDCRRTGCHGSPECLTKPEPICGPSEFSNAKHLGKKFGSSRLRTSNGEIDIMFPPASTEVTDDGGNGNVNIYYNCYPAAVKC